ncbi:hypothetical protein AGMMS49992_06400 [Clostridia bacterium]|nr:hypothetical protein AGMMS49992_06400 [Clostridia bacterium]
MMMGTRKHRVVVLIALLTCVAMLLSGCKLITKDPTVEARTVIAEVGGQQITKGEVLGPYTIMLSQYSSLYSAYGLSFDPTDEAMITNIKQATLTSMTTELVQEQQFAALGLTLSDEDEAQAATDADADFEAYVSSYAASLQSANTSLSDTAARDQAVTGLASQGITRDLMLSLARGSYIVEKLKDNVTEGVVISDEDVEIQAASLRVSQKEKYDATPSSFGTDMTNNVTILYRPEGYRYVKNLLVGISADIQTELDDINSQLSNNAYNRYSLQQQQASFGTIDEATQATLDELYASLDQSDAELNQKLAEKLREGKDQVKARAEEALAKAKENPANFDALIVEYGTDPGMQSEPYKTNGYPVSDASTNYVTSFKDAAVALAAPGDISDLVETDYGYHIIQYASDIPAGDVATAEVQEQLRSELLASRRDELYNQALEDWTAKANIKTYINRWN